MVAAVQQVANVMKLETVAEFVETDAVKKKLRELGVTFAQGDGIAKPKPLADHFSEIIESPEAAVK